MSLIRNHFFSILNFWVFSIVVQLAFMHLHSYWPQDIFAWFFTISWPLAFLAVWLGAPIFVQTKVSEGDNVRIGFIIKISLLAIPLVIISAVILTKLEAFIKPHFVP